MEALGVFGETSSSEAMELAAGENFKTYDLNNMIMLINVKKPHLVEKWFIKSLCRSVLVRASENMVVVVVS